MPERPGTTIERGVVLLTVPAEATYLEVLRTAAAGLAARLHFTLDEIEDLRTAVDEACTMLLRLAAPPAALECRFVVTADELDVETAVPAQPDVPAPTTSSFAWTVLASLTSAARVEVAADGTVTIALTARRATPGR